MMLVSPEDAELLVYAMRDAAMRALDGSEVGDAISDEEYSGIRDSVQEARAFLLWRQIHRLCEIGEILP